MKTKTACFAGHRTLPQERIPEIRRRLITEIETLMACGVTRFWCSGAVGFDTLAGLAVLERKEHNPQLNLIVLHPYRNQELKWFDASGPQYRALLEKADEIVYVSDAYRKVCMKNRGCHLVENSAYCIAYQVTQNDMAAFTVKLARKQGLSVRNLAESHACGSTEAD